MTEQKQDKNSKFSLVPVFLGVAIGVGFNAMLMHDRYQDYLDEAQDMKDKAPYDVRVLSSRDGENKNGDDVTGYTLSKDYMLRLHQCRNDGSAVSTNVKINKKMETSFPDSFLFPDEYKMEQAKKDFRLHMDFNNSFHLYHLSSLSIYSDREELKQNIQGVIQRNDKKFNEKTTLLDFSVEEKAGAKNCRRSFTQTPLAP